MNHWLNALIFGREHPWRQGFSTLLNEVPGVMYGPASEVKL